MSKIIVFHGSDHKIGTSQIAQCCAEYIASHNSSLDVLLLMADGGRGSDYCLKMSESLDKIRPYIAREIINIDELRSKSRYKDNLYILGGNETPQSSDFFTPDLIEFFLSEIRDSFDLIIIDSGSEIDIGSCLGSLCIADRIYLLLAQRESSLRRYEWESFLYDRLDLNLDKFVINMYRSDSPYEKEYISERLNIDQNKMMCIRLDRLGNLSETNSKSILSLKPGRAFVKDIELLAKDILDYAGIKD